MQGRIDLLLEFISCNQPLFYWRYDEEGRLLFSNCSAEKMLDTVFRYSGGIDYILNTAGSSPLVFTNNSNVMWVAVREMKEDTIAQVHVLGPFFANEFHDTSLEKLQSSVPAQASSSWSKRFLEVLKLLPAISLPFYCQYTVMLHYAVTGEKISISNIQYLNDNQAIPPDFSNLKVHTQPKDRMLIYRAERALLNAVREGALGGQAAMAHAASIAKVRQYTDSPLKNAQIACTTFVTLCTRAAIEGGLSTTLSYCLGDAYIKSLFLAKSSSEVMEIKNQMYQDFITRVHNCRNNPQYSKIVQSSCDFIELHISEPINIDMLASRLGYSKYYLSTRFKKETNCSVNNYIKFARIERAKMLLATTNQALEDIAEATGFVSRSFFATTFKRCVGKPPAQYRKENLNA